MLRLRLFAAALLVPCASAQDLLVFESSNDQGHLFSPVDGSLIQQGFIDLTLGTGVPAATPIEAIEVGSELWISDQVADTIFRWSSDGSTYIGEVAIGLDNVRGLDVGPNGNVFVSNAGGSFGNSIVEVDPTGALVSSFATGSPFDVLTDGSSLLVADITADVVERFDVNGVSQGVFSNAPNLDFPEQIQRRTGGYVVAGFISGGLHLLDAAGVETAFLDTSALGFGGVRAGFELQNGNYLFTNGGGIHVLDVAAGTVNTVLSGVSGRFITEYFGGTSCACTGNICTPAALNSSGSSATITAFGTQDVAANDLTLVVSQLPANQFAYFLNSRDQGFVPMVGGSQGNLCLSGSIGRYNAQIFNSGTSGSGSLQLDLTATPTPSGPVAILPGETWFFQCWFRDANPTPTSNFTDGIEIQFL